MEFKNAVMARVEHWQVLIIDTTSHLMVLRDQINGLFPLPRNYRRSPISMRVTLVIRVPKSSKKVTTSPRRAKNDSPLALAGVVRLPKRLCGHLYSLESTITAILCSASLLTVRGN